MNIHRFKQMLRNMACYAAPALLMAAAAQTATAQVPANFPGVVVTTNYAPSVADGYIFMANDFAPANGGFYVMMMNNDGTPFWYKQLTNTAYDFKVLPNGYLHYSQQYQALPFAGAAYVTHQILDENFNPVESINAGNGYKAELHDFHMLPNGHVLVMGYYLTQVDMSQVVSNGNPAALVSGAVIQELDGQRNVVFQWRSWDHYPFTSDWVSGTAAVISEFHINCFFQDTDGNLIISTPQWVKKISRQTGQILWHLGGTENQFTFVGVSQQDGINDFAGHGINRLANGHVLIYNNSSFVPGATSTIHEFALDETNKIATHIWTYTPSPAITAPVTGYAQRLPNGNTFVAWGGIPPLTTVACSELSGTNVVFQMAYTNPGVANYRAFRFPFPSSTQANSNSVIDVATSDSYSFGGTGVSMDVVSGGGGYNRVTVTREPYAPVYPYFLESKDPRAVPVRVSLSEVGLTALNLNIRFNAASFGLVNPANMTVYYRQTTGQGIFTAQPTAYNPVTGNLSVSMNLTAQGIDLGEFIFCYPDLPDLAIPPLLAQPANYQSPQPSGVIMSPLAASNSVYSVNQERPITLSWSPAGLAAYHEIEIATNRDFTNPVLAVPYQPEAFFVWSNATANSTYYYRVRTWNNAGASDWSTGAFQTVAPLLAITAPNGGEMWQRGLTYFIRWQANLAENVKIDLYKAGAYVATIASNTPCTGAYSWQVGLNLVPGNDYTIRITSLANSSLTAASHAAFGIDMPYIDASSATLLPSGYFTFNIIAPNASQVSVLGSTNLASWQLLQIVPVTNNIASFIDDVPANLQTMFYRFSVP